MPTNSFPLVHRGKPLADVDLALLDENRFKGTTISLHDKRNDFCAPRAKNLTQEGAAKVGDGDTATDSSRL